MATAGRRWPPPGRRLATAWSPLATAWPPLADAWPTAWPPLATAWPRDDAWACKEKSERGAWTTFASLCLLALLEREARGERGGALTSCLRASCRPAL